jgi:DNA-binding GntR family transcriptional regulator
MSSPAYRIIRLRSINQEPVLIESYTIPLARFPGLDASTWSSAPSMKSWRRIQASRSPAPGKAFEPVAASVLNLSC